MCQNNTMRAYGTCIKIYCVLCTKAYSASSTSGLHGLLVMINVFAGLFNLFDGIQLNQRGVFIQTSGPCKSHDQTDQGHLDQPASRDLLGIKEKLIFQGGQQFAVLCHCALFGQRRSNDKDLMVVLNIVFISWYTLRLTLQWHHTERDGTSNHIRLECFLNRLFRRRSKKTPKLRVTGLCKGIYRWPVDSPQERVFGDVILTWGRQDTPVWLVAVKMLFARGVLHGCWITSVIFALYLSSELLTMWPRAAKCLTIPGNARRN